jgi:hypothetical protein
VDFQKMIIDEGWPSDWFEKSESGHEPWIFYMSQSFVSHCLAMIEDVLKGLGAFVRKNN